MEIYKPREDSFLLATEIGKFLDLSHSKPQIALDMGSGTGIQAEMLELAQIPKILCADISQEAVGFLNSKGFHAIQSDLFSNIKAKFDLIIFNPPYLPGLHEQDPCIFAGPNGNEIILDFLRQATAHLNKNGIIFLLFSSFSDEKTILEHARKMNYDYEKIKEKQFFDEILYVYKFCCPSRDNTNI